MRGPKTPTVRAIISCGALITIAAAGVVVRTGSKADGDLPPWAYATEHDVVVMRGTTEVTRVRRLFDLSGGPQQKLAWSTDQGRVAFIDDAVLRQLGEKSKKLVVVDIASGKVTRFPCPYCIDVVGYGTGYMTESENYASDDSPTFRVLDGQGRHEPVPAFPGSFEWTLLGGATADTLVSRREAVNGTAQQALLRLSDSSSSWTTVGQFSSDDLDELAFRRTGRDISGVVADASNTAGCGKKVLPEGFELDGPVTKTFPTHMRDNAHAPGPQSEVLTRDIWTDHGGQTYASMVWLNCSANSLREAVVSGPSIYALDRNTWVPQHPTARSPRASVWRDLRANERAVLMLPYCTSDEARGRPPQQCLSGDLDIVGSNNTKRRIATDVLFISKPSALD